MLACRLMFKPLLSSDDVTVADVLLLHFCKCFEELYGKEYVTPNMHMHGHLVECINEYGPLSSFWLFPFERYNGILEGTPTNNRSVEVQIMRKFLVDIQNLSLLQLEKANSILADAVLSQAATFQSIAAYKGK